MTVRGWIALGFALSGIVAACAPPPAPSAQLDAARRAIEAANEAGAPRDDRAVTYLRSARDELRDAQRFAARQRMERARSMAMRAEADALLAEAIAHETEVASTLRPARGGER